MAVSAIARYFFLSRCNVSLFFLLTVLERFVTFAPSSQTSLGTGQNMVATNYGRLVLDTHQILSCERSRRHVKGWRQVRAKEDALRVQARLPMAWERTEVSPGAVLVGLLACVATMIASAAVLSW